MEILELLKDAVERHASDIFIVAGRPVVYKINDNFIHRDEVMLLPPTTNSIVRSLYEKAENRDFNKLELGDDDFALTLPGISRFRVNVFKQRSSLAAVVRVIRFELPNPEELSIPKVVMDLANKRKGLVLVTGTAGSGKSTTLACLIDQINKTRSEHIITLEDPLEYLHRHNLSIISQREVLTDTESYIKAIRASLRQAPDVILLGEMRDHETISVAMTAAETGHLVFSTLHTVGAAHTVDRVIDAFPANQQTQIRIQLSMILQAVVSQQLVPTVYQSVAPAFEIMVVNSAIRNMIREAKIHQIDSVIHSSSAEGMITMDASLLGYLKKGIITPKTAIEFSSNPEQMAKKV